MRLLDLPLLLLLLLVELGLELLGRLEQRGVKLNRLTRALDRLAQRRGVAARLSGS